MKKKINLIEFKKIQLSVAELSKIKGGCCGECATITGNCWTSCCTTDHDSGEQDKD
jgi:hypothetical protein